MAKLGLLGSVFIDSNRSTGVTEDDPVHEGLYRSV